MAYSILSKVYKNIL